MNADTLNVLSESEQTVLDAQQLYREYGRTVARWCARLAPPGVEADDLLQDVFVVVQRKLHTFEPSTCKITTWLYAITSRTASDARRRARRKTLWGLLSTEENVLENTISARQELARVLTSMEKLPNKQREAFVLFELEGLTPGDISELMSMPVSTVYVNIHRARLKLLKDFEERRSKEHSS